MAGKIRKRFSGRCLAGAAQPDVEMTRIILATLICSGPPVDRHPHAPKSFLGALFDGGGPPCLQTEVAEYNQRE